MEYPSGFARTRKFAVSVLLLALLSQPSYAQSLPESPRQKAEEARKKVDEKANEEAYKALIKRTPDPPIKRSIHGVVYDHLRNPRQSKLITAEETNDPSWRLQLQRVRVKGRPCEPQR